MFIWPSLRNRELFYYLNCKLLHVVCRTLVLESHRLAGSSLYSLGAVAHPSPSSRNLSSLSWAFSAWLIIVSLSSGSLFMLTPPIYQFSSSFSRILRHTHGSESSLWDLNNFVVVYIDANTIHLTSTEGEVENRPFWNNGRTFLKLG